MKKFFLFLCIVYASPALALTCLNDYSDGVGCDGNSNSAGDCATLGYSTESVSGCSQYLYCPFNTSYKRCVSTTTSNTVDCTELGFTSSDKSEWCSKIVKCKDNAALTLCEQNLTCANNQILINGECQPVYTSCSAAGYIAPSECTAGYSCSGDVTIYTSTTGTTTNCYKNKLQKVCNLGYATTASDCSRTPEGTTCGNYLLLKQIALVGEPEPTATHYSGENGCWACSCGIIKENCTGSTYCPTGAKCSECQNDSGRTLYTITSCATGYVKDGDSCYDCAGMQTTMHAAGRKGSSGYKTYIQACYSSYCAKDSSTSCSGNNGYRAWDQHCLCNIISKVTGDNPCLLSVTEADQIAIENNSTAPCSETKKARCEAAKTGWAAAVSEHNSKCPSSYKVTDYAFFNCNSYIPEDEKNGSLGALSMCSYHY